MISGINWLAVLVGVVIMMALGSFWYSPVGFGKVWMKLVGKSEKDLKKGSMPQMYGITAVLSFVNIFVLALVIQSMQATSAISGAGVGILTWVGFVVATSGVAYLFEGRPQKLFLINSGYFFVGFVINGAVLALWR